MFKSQLTGKLYGPKIKPVRVVVETRERSYMNHQGTISHGHEIVKELLIGPDEKVPVE